LWGGVVCFLCFGLWGGWGWVGGGWGGGFWVGVLWGVVGWVVGVWGGVGWVGVGLGVGFGGGVGVGVGVGVRVGVGLLGVRVAVRVKVRASESFTGTALWLTMHPGYRCCDWPLPPAPTTGRCHCPAGCGTVRGTGRGTLIARAELSCTGGRAVWPGWGTSPRWERAMGL